MQYADRVQETTATAGTGTITLAGASAGYRAFSATFITGAQISYCLVDGTAWEVGYGTLTAGGSWTLSRDVLLASSTGAAINLSGGSTTVFCTAPAANIDWPTQSTTVASADAVTIPAGRQLLLANNFDLDGTLNAFGDLAIL
jgi:hypothetical protein